MSLLTKKAAIKFLGIGKTRFEHILKSGNLKCKIVGNSVMFTERSLQEWLDTPDSLTKYTREKTATATGLKSLPPSADKEYSFVKVQESMSERKQRPMPDEDLRKSWKKSSIAQTQLN